MPTGKYPRPSPETRFWQKVNKQGPYPSEPGPLYNRALGPCWLWTGTLKDTGYGRFYASWPKTVRAHRFAYELMVGSSPEDTEFDHLCRVRHCDNPQHLKPEPHQINCQRSKEAQKTHCKNGHLYDEANTYFDLHRHRYCRTCRGKNPFVRASHCKRGHPFDEANTQIWKGHRHCRTCKREAMREYRLNRQSSS
jgi:hypothetical protein